MKHATDPLLSEERAALAGLLGEVSFDRYGDARRALEPPLAHLLYALYRHRTEAPVEVDILDHEGVSFLFDSADSFLGEGSDRVAAVIATSRSRLSFEGLLERLRDERADGGSVADTLEQIHFKLKTFQNAASGSRFRRLCHAVAQTLRLTELPVPEILERILEGCSTAGRFEVAKLRAVARILRRACQDAGASPCLFRIERGEILTADRLQPLREMAATRFSAEIRSSLTLELAGFHFASALFRQRLAEEPSSDLLERARVYLVPLLDRESSRPRDALAQRKARLAMGSSGLYDVGHFAPHAAGGPTRVNFFLQERRLNRGWSEQGRQYCWMERYVTSHPGTVYFVRPIYEDASDVPRYLEWGILLGWDEAASLASEIASRPALCLLSGPRNGVGLRAAWLMGLFDNLPEEGSSPPVRLDPAT